MTVQMPLPIAAVILLSVAMTMPAVYGAEPPRVQIAEIKAHPDRYDGRTVELLGILDSGHLGVFLGSRHSDAVVRLRLTPADPSDDAQIVRDKLFDQLRGLAAKTEVPGEPEQKFEVLVVGRVRVLKDGGKPRKKYYPQIESPVEVIVIRVLSLSNAGAKR
jgi:hypothetical protein